MKKILLSLALVAGITSAAQAQVEIGLKISPNIGTNRVSSTRDFKLTSDGARVHFGGGLVVDYFFGENYAFTTGLELIGKGGTIKTRVLGLADTTTELGLQYLQLPVGIKLFTNEVAPDTRVYFQLGGEVGALIGGKVNGNKNEPTSASRKVTKGFNTPELGVALGIGAEMQMGKSTKVFGGFSYRRGLTDIADDSFLNAEENKDFDSKEIVIQNSLFALDLGLKF